jgi:hypothetical protein
MLATYIILMTPDDKEPAWPSLNDESPKVFMALQRFLAPDELAALESDYQRCVSLGGNVEAGMTREEGVSFNPRLARILSIMIHDGGVRDFESLRSALCAACDSLREKSSALVKGVIALDSIRHLHQTDFSEPKRQEILLGVESTLLGQLRNEMPEWLQKKLEHAIALQRRV